MNGTRKFIVRHLLCLWIKNYFSVLSHLSLSLSLFLSLSLSLSLLRSKDGCRDRPPRGSEYACFCVRSYEKLARLSNNATKGNWPRPRETSWSFHFFVTFACKTLGFRVFTRKRGLAAQHVNFGLHLAREALVLRLVPSRCEKVRR